MRCECQLFTESSVCLENVLGVDGLELLVHFINCSWDLNYSNYQKKKWTALSVRSATIMESEPLAFSSPVDTLYVSSVLSRFSSTSDFYVLSARPSMKLTQLLTSRKISPCCQLRCRWALLSPHRHTVTLGIAHQRVGYQLHRLDLSREQMTLRINIASLIIRKSRHSAKRINRCCVLTVCYMLTRSTDRRR